jgi:hypothetical protein
LAQTKDDGTHVILPATARVTARPDGVGLPVMLRRHADGKVRHGGYPAANVQRSCAVDQRGRLHGASELAAIASISLPLAPEHLVEAKETVDNGKEKGVRKRERFDHSTFRPIKTAR